MNELTPGKFYYAVFVTDEVLKVRFRIAAFFLHIDAHNYAANLHLFHPQYTDIRCERIA